MLRSLTLAAAVAATAAATPANLRVQNAIASTSPSRGWSMADPPSADNLTPTIGILSIPLESSPHCVTVARARGLLREDGTSSSGSPRLGDVSPSCFQAYYPHWVYAAGARVAVIPFDAPQALMDEILDSVNGVLLTGGGLEADVQNLTSPYVAAAGYILAKAQAKTDAGIFFPVHGTCQGFQVLTILTAQDPGVLVENAYDSEDLPLALTFNTTETAGSRLIGQAPGNVYTFLGSENVTLNLHHDGVSPDAWFNNSRLPSFYRLLSTNLDRAGKPFVSTLEARDYPITGTQWHPERPQFQWTPGEGIPHSLHAITANAYIASFFINDARRNNQSFANQTLAELLSMYSYPLVSVGPVLNGDQAYLFNL